MRLETIIRASTEVCQGHKLSYNKTPVCLYYKYPGVTCFYQGEQIRGVERYQCLLPEGYSTKYQKLEEIKVNK